MDRLLKPKEAITYSKGCLNLFQDQLTIKGINGIWLNKIDAVKGRPKCYIVMSIRLWKSKDGGS